MTVKSATKKRWAKGDPHRAVLTSINTWVWYVCSDATEIEKKPGQDVEESSPFIRLVNRESDRLTKAIRAALRESVRELPGRAQKGEVDRLMRAVAPKIEKALQGIAK